MTWAFIITIIVVFLAHTALIAYIMYKLDNSEKITTILGCSTLWTLYIAIWGGMILFPTIEDKGLHYGESLYSAPLKPFNSSCGNSIYLERTCKTCHFILPEDSSIWINTCLCRTDFLEEGETPYCELVAIKAAPWVLKILEPDHQRLQPRYVLHIPEDGEYVEPCGDEEDDYWEVSPYY